MLYFSNKMSNTPTANSARTEDSQAIPDGVIDGVRWGLYQKPVPVKGRAVFAG